MALDEIIDPLNKLLSQIQRGQGVHSQDPESGSEHVYLISCPPDLLPSSSTSMLWLLGETARLYGRCQSLLLQEGERGELEHLPQRDIERRLRRLTWETLLQRNELRSQDCRTKVDQFIAENRLPHRKWEVLWEIEDLNVDQAFRVGDVEFFQFPDERAHTFLRPQGDPWRKSQEELFGRAFARVVVYAGAKERALSRGKVAIDDALHMMRVALVSKVPEIQLLQRRGHHYIAAPLTDPLQGVTGAVRERGPYPLDVGATLADVLREWPLARIFDPSCQAAQESRERHGT